MKSFIATVLITIIFTSCNRNIAGPKAEYQDLRYSKDFEVPNKTSEDIFIYFQEWFISTFTDKTYVIELEDIDRGIIIARYTTRTNVEEFVKYYIKSTLTVRIQDGKYSILYQYPSFSKEITGHRPITRKTNVLLATQEYWKTQTQQFHTELSY